MTDTVDVGRRRSKGAKRARTRAALLEAARTLIREEGYERVTLHAVARRAGMTTGAIYGNFGSRAELFVALGEAYWAPIKPRVRPRATFGEAMRAMAEAALAVVADRESAAVGRLTGLAYALTHEELRERAREVTQHHYALGAEWLRATFDERELTMPAERLVPIIHALTEGLVLQRLLTPELVPDDVFYGAFEALARQPNGSAADTAPPTPFAHELV